jgi:hypothetical protein
LPHAGNGNLLHHEAVGDALEGDFERELGEQAEAGFWGRWHSLMFKRNLRHVRLAYGETGTR